MEQIKSALEAMSDDHAFGEKITELLKAGDTAGLAAAAKEKGFDVTEANWQAYIDFGSGKAGTLKTENCLRKNWKT